MKHVPSLLVAVFLGFVAVSGCKSNDIAQTNNTSGTGIGPQGGTVNGPDGSEVRVPGGALTENTAIAITVAPPSDYPALDAAYTSLGKVYSFTPHGLKFNAPVIVDVPFQTQASSYIVLHASPGGTWSEVNGTQQGSLVEVSATTFSFFTVVTKATANDGGAATCSGRGPLGGSPTGSVSNMTGRFVAATGTGVRADVDLTTIVDGYARAGGGGFHLVFAPYQNACGTFANGITKLGTNLAWIYLYSPLQGSTITPGQYDVNKYYAGSAGVPANQDAGSCNGDGIGDGSPTTGQGVTITAVDSKHVAGSFNFTPANGTAAVSGTFDLPICAEQPNLNPRTCCIP